MKKMLLSLLSIHMSMQMWACVQVPARPQSLADQLMQIDAVIPQESSLVRANSRMAVLFSQPLDRTSVTDQNILLIHGEVDTQTDYDVSTLYSNINRERVEKIPLQFSFSRNRKLLVLTPGDALAEGETYTLLITSRVLSQNRLPILQEVSRIPLKVTYRVLATQTSEVSSAGSSVIVAPDAVDAMIAQVMAEQDSDSSNTSTTIPATPEPSPEVPITSASGGSGASAIPPESGSGVVSPPVTEGSGAVSGEPAPARVVINEIYYDAVGSDTDGVVFVELYGASQTSLDHFKINFVNGSDGVVYDSITLPDNAQINAQGFYVVADARTGSPTLTQVLHADLVDSFDPQNGPDAIQLLDANQQLLDAVGYGEGIIAQAANHLNTYEGVPGLDVVNGHSLERISPGYDTQNNASDFVDRLQPTPGE